MEVKITVITVCYNAQSVIERTMRSILNQTFKDFQYIIVDGKSSDNTSSVVNEIISEYPTSDILFISEKDKGIYDAMNKGIKIAKGEWICMMNAGDVFADNHVLENIFNQEIPDNISFLYSDMLKQTSFGKTFRVEMHCDDHERKVVHQCVIYKRSLHQCYGFYNVTPKLIISDYLFFLQVPMSNILKIDKIIAIYEGGGASEQGSWCIKQILCADVVFRHRSFYSIFFDLVYWKIKHAVPRVLREKLRLIHNS